MQFADCTHICGVLNLESCLLGIHTGKKISQFYNYLTDTSTLFKALSIEQFANLHVLNISQMMQQILQNGDCYFILYNPYFITE